MNLREKYLQEALKELAERRQRNQRITDQRHEQIRKELPEIAALRRRLAERTAALVQETIDSPQKKSGIYRRISRLTTPNR